MGWNLTPNYRAHESKYVLYGYIYCFLMFLNDIYCFLTTNYILFHYQCNHWLTRYLFSTFFQSLLPFHIFFSHFYLFWAFFQTFLSIFDGVLDPWDGLGYFNTTFYDSLGVFETIPGDFHFLEILCTRADPLPQWTPQ